MPCIYREGRRGDFLPPVLQGARGYKQFSSAVKWPSGCNTLMSIILLDIMNTELDILIVGGGFSGTMLAAHLLRRAEGYSVGIVDRSSQPGRGIAYSSPHRFHLL